LARDPHDHLDLLTILGVISNVCSILAFLEITFNIRQLTGKALRIGWQGAKRLAAATLRLSKSLTLLVAGAASSIGQLLLGVLRDLGWRIGKSARIEYWREKEVALRLRLVLQTIPFIRRPEARARLRGLLDGLVAPLNADTDRVIGEFVASLASREPVLRSEADLETYTRRTSNVVVQYVRGRFRPSWLANPSVDSFA